MYSGEQQRDSLIAAAIEKIPKDKPIAVINLLRFRKQADYTGIVPPSVTSQPTPCSGEEAYYNRYFPAYHEGCKDFFGDQAGKEQKILYLGKEMLPLMAGGSVPSTEEANYWHTVVIGQYPSFEQAMNWQKSEAYTNFSFHRTAALENNRLWVTEPVFTPN